MVVVVVVAWLLVAGSVAAADEPREDLSYEPAYAPAHAPAYAPAITAQPAESVAIQAEVEFSGDAAPAMAGLWAAALSPTTSVRIAAARALRLGLPAGWVSVAWLLAYDSDAEVRAAAFGAVCELCPHESATVCNALLGVFVDDSELAVAWGARDLLLRRDPEVALDGADRAYKLDVLSGISARGEGTAQSHDQQTLKLLLSDFDLEVRETAQLVLNRHRP